MSTEKPYDPNTDPHLKIVKDTSSRRKLREISGDSDDEKDDNHNSSTTKANKECKGYQLPEYKKQRPINHNNIHGIHSQSSQFVMGDNNKSNINNHDKTNNHYHLYYNEGQRKLSREKKYENFSLKKQPTQLMNTLMIKVTNKEQLFGFLIVSYINFPSLDYQRIYKEIVQENDLEKQKKIFCVAFGHHLHDKSIKTKAATSYYVVKICRAIIDNPNWKRDVEDFNHIVLKQLGVIEEDEDQDDDMVEGPRWDQLLMRDIKDFHDEHFLPTAIIYGFSQKEVMALHEVDIMRQLVPKRADDEILADIYAVNNDKDIRDNVWWFIRGLKERYDKGN